MRDELNVARLGIFHRELPWALDGGSRIQRVLAKRELLESGLTLLVLLEAAWVAGAQELPATAVAPHEGPAARAEQEGSCEEELMPSCSGRGNRAGRLPTTGIKKLYKNPLGIPRGIPS